MNDYSKLTREQLVDVATKFEIQLNREKAIPTDPDGRVKAVKEARDKDRIDQDQRHQAEKEKQRAEIDAQHKMDNEAREAGHAERHKSNAGLIATLRGQVTDLTAKLAAVTAERDALQPDVVAKRKARAEALAVALAKLSAEDRALLGVV